MPVEDKFESADPLAKVSKRAGLRSLTNRANRLLEISSGARWKSFHSPTLCAMAPAIKPRLTTIPPSLQNPTLPRIEGPISARIRPCVPWRLPGNAIKTLIGGVAIALDRIRPVENQIFRNRRATEAAWYSAASAFEELQHEQRRLQSLRQGLENQAGLPATELRKTWDIVPRADREADAGKLDLPLQKIRRAMRIAHEPISLETPVGEEDESHPGDFTVDHRTASPSEQMINLNLHEQTAEVLKSLSPARAKDYPVAVRPKRRPRTHLRRSGPKFFGYAGTHPRNRGQSVANLS